MSLRRDEPLCIFVRISADRTLRAVVIGQQSRFFVFLEGFVTYGALLHEAARRIAERKEAPETVRLPELAEECV